mgnify:CR=1 FL=1
MKHEEVIISKTKLSVYTSLHEGKKVYVFLHGWGSSAAALRSLLPRTDDFVAIDFPGHGYSAALSRVWNLHDFVAVVDAYLNKYCAGKKVILVGHSFGCRVGALLASQPTSYPISSVTFISPLFFPDTRLQTRTIRFGAHWIGKIFSSIGLGDMKTAMLRRFGHVLGAGDYSQLVTDSMRTTFQNIIAYDLSNALAAIAVPCKIIWGTEDTTVVRERIDKAVAILHCPLYTINNAGHFPFIDNLREVQSHTYVD